MSGDDKAQKTGQLQVDLADEKGVSRSWLRKYCQNERRLEECRAKISALQNELVRTLHELGAAEALNAEAARANAWRNLRRRTGKAGPIVDNRIRELEAALVESRQACVNVGAALSGHVSRNAGQAKEIEQLRQELAAARACRVVVATEQPAETELERRAWELYSRIADMLIEYSFLCAGQWMAYRDEHRKAGGT